LHSAYTYTPKHRTVLVIFPPILQTIITAWMMSIGGDRAFMHCKSHFSYKIQVTKHWSKTARKTRDE